MRLNRTMYFKILKYYLIFLIPLATVSIFVYSQVLSSFGRFIVSSNEVTLRNLQHGVEGDIEKIMQAAINLGNSDSVFNDQLKYRPYKGRDVIRALGNYYTTVSYVHTLAYYPYNSNFIYTNNSSLDRNMFFNSIYRYVNISRDQFESDILNTRYTAFYPCEAIDSFAVRGNFITFVYPLANGKGNFIALIPDSFILSKLNNTDDDIVILDEAGEVLLSTIKDPGILSHLTGPDSQTSLESREYIITSKTFDITGWRFYILSRTDRIMAPINRISVVYVSVLLILLALISFLIVWLTKREYHPLAHILNQADKYLGTADINKKSDFNKIEFALEYLENVNNVLKSWQQSNRPQLVRQRISSLITGDYTDLPALLTELQEMDVHFKHAHFAVITIEMGYENTQKLPGCPDLLLDSAFTSCDIYSAYDINNRYRSFLINLPTTNLISQGLEAFCDRCSELGLSCAIGVSELFYQINDVFNGYDQSMQALGYKILFDHNTPIYFNATRHDILSVSRIDTLLLNNIIERLEVELSKNMQAQSVNLIRNFFRILEESDASVLEVMLSCYRIIYFTINYINSRRIDDAEIFEYIAKHLLNFKNIQTLEKELIFVCAKIGEYSSVNEDHADDFVDAIRSEMEQNFKDINFSINTVAQSRNMSVSNLSHSYKRKTGENFSAALDNLRIKHAIMLLETTSLHVKEISALSGYYNIGTFQRNFKNKTGVTPGMYKKGLSSNI